MEKNYVSVEHFESEALGLGVYVTLLPLPINVVFNFNDLCDMLDLKFQKRKRNEYRRKGLASKVINRFKENHKGKYITGDSLPGAIKFWESMGAEFYEDPFDDYCTPFIIEF